MRLAKKSNWLSIFNQSVYFFKSLKELTCSLDHVTKSVHSLILYYTQVDYTVTFLSLCTKFGWTKINLIICQKISPKLTSLIVDAK